MSEGEPSTKQQVLEEINSLSSELGVKCRVIENVGAFQFVVSMSCQRAPEVGGVKLQLTDKYPLEPPCVSVRSAPSAEASLAALAAQLRGRAMLRALAEGAFSSAQSQAPTPAAKEAAPTLKEQQQQQQRRGGRQSEARAAKRKERAAAAAASVAGSKKLKPMKTADDVIKRIQWDAGIPSHEMAIGYLDRFKGIVEKPWAEFSWEDIASVDYFTFVIPRHRICYFKYRRAIVWDKRRRLDLVFGSTAATPAPAQGAASAGSAEEPARAPSDIYELIANYRDEDYPDGEASMASADSDSNSDLGSGSDESGDDSDDSDGVEVRLDRRAVDLAGRLSDQAEGDSAGEDEPESERREFPGRGGQYWRDLLRPNFFVCVRVTDPGVAAAAAALQSRIVSQQPAYQSCCIPPEMLHCTLLTLRLDNAEQVSTCASVLASAQAEFLATLPREPLTIRGTGCFFGRVLHARVNPVPAGLLEFVDHLQAVVRSAGLQVLETHDFVPHVTLMKTSRPVSRQLGSRLIPPWLYSGSENTVYGQQAFDAIYLCSMEKARGPDGFYVAPGCVQFVRTVLQVPRDEAQEAE